MREITLIDAIKEAYQEELRRDEAVYMIGQDIRGGIFPHSMELVQEFGSDRIVDTPIAECGMFGTAMGSAMVGKRPIVDFMFGNFTYYAAGEVMVTAAQQHFMHGSQTAMPMVITAAVGTTMQLGNDHAVVPKAPLIHQPGVKYCFPSTPADAKGLMKASVRDNNPVIMFWHMGLMMDRGPVPEDEDFIIPLGVSEVKREGTDVTLVANGLMYKYANEVAEKLEGEISVEIVDPRSFVPLDMDTIIASLAKTNHMVIADEDYYNCGWAGECMARVIEQGFDYLDAPIERVCVDDVPIPGGTLEPLVCPTPDKIEAAIRRVIR